jgi:hypothetical protein
MIAAKILEPKTGLTPMSRRRVAVALGLALAAALRRVGRFEHAEIRAWRGVPDVQGEKIDIELGNRVDINVVDSIAKCRGWDGITITLDGEFGMVKLGVDIDVYAHEHVPVQAGITKERINVLAEPRGHVWGGGVVESFYELFGVEEKKMRILINEFIAEMRCMELEVETYTEASMWSLWRLVAKVYAMRDYSFRPEYAMPLWYRPWVRQMAEDLYRLAPPRRRELVGLLGMRRVVKCVAPELLKYLMWYYEVKLHEDALQLVPSSTNSHRGAIEDLRDKLTQSINAVSSIEAKKIIEKRGYLDWEEYIRTLEEDLRRRFTP